MLCPPHTEKSWIRACGLERRVLWIPSNAEDKGFAQCTCISMITKTEVVIWPSYTSSVVFARMKIFADIHQNGAGGSGEFIWTEALET